MHNVKEVTTLYKQEKIFIKKCILLKKTTTLINNKGDLNDYKKVKI